MTGTEKPRVPQRMLAYCQRWLPAIGPVLALLAIYGLFALLTESFRTWGNVETVGRQTVIVATAGLGMTLIMIMGGIDLSVGSIVALSTVVIALLLKAQAGSLTALAAGVAVGAACGVLNGLLVTGLRLVPFIATLGTMLVVRGAAKGLASQQTVSPAPELLGWLRNFTSSVSAQDAWLLLPPGVWLMLLLCIVVAGVLHYTRLGRHIFAIGSNEQTARLCGVRVERVKIVVYTLSAALAGLAGVMQFSRLIVGDPTAAQGLELDTIAAVVIGGGSLAGGKGSVLGTLVGALIMTVISAGCQQMDIPPWVREIITGGIIIAAVAMDSLRQRR